MKPSMKKTLLGVTMAAVISSPVVANEVRIYNWSDYIAEDTIEKFEAATGIRVIYDMFDSNEVLEAKVLAGNSGYDVVVPTANYMARQIAAGAYQKLDKSLIPNYSNLDMGLMDTLRAYDRNLEYGVPWQWGTTGLGYNVDKIQEILGDDAPWESWDLLFNPEYASKLAQCGIAVLDSSGEVLPLAMFYLGLDPNSINAADYQKAEELMLSIRPYITYFHSSRYITDLANGDICLAMGWSGDVFIAQARAEEAGRGVEIAYVIPEEGTAIWSDMMVIPADARNVANAHAWINFALDAQIGADITNYVWYGSPNLASREFIDPDILDDPGIFPDDDAELFTFEVLPPSVDRIRTRSWTRIKSSR
ncbi:polyamine ABC transporter substrate-binding protein [Salinispirillum sp. LH 10-3-1]|uniref:Putrescine-binding periplasmic protein n=2 Tax=Salinispirillum sp. LH 10-3-1 TaxID=2952525 RepID=A0AB38YH52_9GAMM